MTETLTRLRDMGWSIAIHNDYKLNGLPYTFWLFTHPSGHWVKGEGATDEDALCDCLREAFVAMLRAPHASADGDHAVESIRTNVGVILKEIDRLRAGLKEIASMGDGPFNRQSIRARELLLDDLGSSEEKTTG